MADETEVEDLANARWTGVKLRVQQDGKDGPYVQVEMCLLCGCLVMYAKAIHEGRCFGEVKEREDDEFARTSFEERIAEGEYDEELT